MSTKDHWEQVYRTKERTEVSWYRPHLERSLELIDGLALPEEARLVDIGGGASTLVDDLLMRGFSKITVVDLAGAALEHARRRLGERGATVTWLEGDVTQPLLAPSSVDLWHDRAVFHFLADPEHQAAYRAQLASAVRPGGYAVVGTFALDGPERCSGLPVVRHDSEGLAAALGPDFSMVTEAREIHRTPAGKEQPFSYVLCRRRTP
ncbi:MAG: class I SAM-dependent methyltransferase [Polyangiaceae bacterium]|jgi:SAM-dependent methyltransferase|nr:class I SAM-dependent methyltransferase [Polyangiaceae bacterium]